ncbi:MAG: enoyl-CoA hydratase [Hyphomicrobiales bacterium]|nr:enoyl-CoA hydratase [Hyphomicrobiales bacterium]
MSYQYIIAEKQGRVGVITFNRPDVLNALSRGLTAELRQAIETFETDSEINCLILTGSERAFAAGADINEMQNLTVSELIANDFIEDWESVARCRKPVIAVVRGFALGGGCEIALMCDFIIASDTAKFGQPEIKIGVIPGAGGSQRLAHFVGKSKAMDMCLTGRMMDAQEAERCGMVARVVPDADVMGEAMTAAEAIAGYSQVALMAAKEAVNKAFEGGLGEGVHFERRIFHALFATEDQKEGMSAFLAKRKPEFKDR